MNEEQLIIVAKMLNIFGVKVGIEQTAAIEKVFELVKKKGNQITIEDIDSIVEMR